MTTEEMERAIQFLLDHHARVSADIGRLHETQVEQSKQIGRLTEAVAATQSHLDSVIDEMQEGFNKLLATNDLTNSLIEKLTMLEVQNSQRVAGLERRVDDLESKP